MEIKEKVQQDPIWALLPEKQKAFVLAFLDTHDKVQAAKIAYGCTDYKKANTQGNRTVKYPNVRKILRNAGDKSLVEGGVIGTAELLQLISDRLRNVETDAASFVKLAEMLRKIRPGRTRDEENPSDAADDLAREREKLRKSNA